MKRRGWYGDSHGHSMAARGIRMYNKSKLVDPVFFAQKHESKLPMAHIIDMVRGKKSLQEMERMHPDADKEDLKRRALKGIEMVDADDTLTVLEKQGVDASVVMAEHRPVFKRKALEVLGDRQGRSFLSDEKAAVLKSRLGAIR
ncbi:hypothetical protein GOV11_00950 [Candidatus Woesearchaeota archaeon]|nr:hypothetical protein [Candidatus Woesearchaeota archaeon]